MYIGKITEHEMITLEYLSKTILCGVRPYELEILNRLIKQEEISYDSMKKEFQEKYGYAMENDSFENAIHVLQGKFWVIRSEIHHLSGVWKSNFRLLRNHDSTLLEIIFLYIYL